MPRVWNSTEGEEEITLNRHSVVLKPLINIKIEKCFYNK